MCVCQDTWRTDRLWQNFWSKDPKVAYVNYPGLPSNKYYERAKKYMPDGGCGVVSFGLKGGREVAFRIHAESEAWSD